LAGAELITEHSAAAGPPQVPDRPGLETRVQTRIAEVADQRKQVDAVIREMQTAASVVSLLAPPTTPNP
jgi:chaperonin cofactor prefoldin